jgi:hypothetical protein
MREVEREEDFSLTTVRCLLIVMYVLELCLSQETEVQEACSQ